MLYRLHNKLNKAWFNWNCRRVYDTPPVHCDSSSSVLVLTQTYHPDMIMYLLAAKSFARFVVPRGFVVVDDGLTNEDRRTLAEHLGQVQFVPTSTVQRGACPAGGTWERLLTIIDLSPENYVIQLDSDTLTLAEPTEVINNIVNNKSFTLGTSMGQQLVSFEEASQVARESGSSEHVQMHAERAFAEYPGKEQLRYVRGCSGFAGFARNQFNRNAIDRFSKQMDQLIGAQKWREWGSEQVTSNYLIANAPDAQVLPVKRYFYLAPSTNSDDLALVHFLGSYRYEGGTYRRLSCRFIECLC